MPHLHYSSTIKTSIAIWKKSRKPGISPLHPVSFLSSSQFQYKIWEPVKQTSSNLLVGVFPKPGVVLLHVELWLWNKAGYTANKQSLAGGQGRYTEGQGQSISGQGLYFGWAGAVMLRNCKVGQFLVVQNFLWRTLIESLSQRLKS